MGEGQSAEVLPSPAEISEERLLALIFVRHRVGWHRTGFPDIFQRPLLAVPRLVENEYYVDEIYDATIIHPIEVGRVPFFGRSWTRKPIDGGLHALGRAVTDLGRARSVTYKSASCVVTQPSFGCGLWRCFFLLWLLRHPLADSLGLQATRLLHSHPFASRCGGPAVTILYWTAALLRR